MKRTSFLTGLIVSALTALIAAGLVPPLVSYFDFANRAIIKAGDDPPVTIAAQNEWLLGMQAYANAILVGATLSLLMNVVALSRTHGKSSGKASWLGKRMISIIASAIAFGLICFLYQRQSVGSQNLLLTSFLQAVLWGSWGYASASRGTRAHSAIAGLLWGMFFPLIGVLCFPDVYIEQLFPKDVFALRVWATGGVFCCLMGYLLPGFQSERRRSITSEQEAVTA